MIKNKTQLINLLGKDAEILLDIAEFTLKNLLPKKILQKEIKKINPKRYKKIVIFAIGKAAKTMARATQVALNIKNIKTLLADEGHPFPNKAGIQKTKKIITTTQSLTKNDLAIVLLSGGGSAMFVQPVNKITLEEKIDLTKQLLRSGANIQEINTVRKHLSQVKGGNFAKLLYPAQVKCFVISDVIGNDLSVIASGPLSPDPSTFKNALNILKKYKIKAAKNIEEHLKNGLKDKELETPKSKAKFFKNITIKILSDHNLSANLAEKRAKQLKLKAKIISTSLSGESREIAKKLVKNQKTTRLLIATGETTVTCKGTGHGGRNQEFVLAALPHLKNQTILSIGTDGVDGICPEKIAGAIANKKHLKIKAFLDNNDSYTFFKKTGGLIKTGPTGTNVGDLILLLKNSHLT